MGEFWKDVIGYEGLYQVSNIGKVKSLERSKLVKGKYPGVQKEKILKPGIDTSGYFFVCLFNDSVKTNKSVHQLVAESFLNHNPCGFKLVVNHINLNKSDNRLENLEIVTNRDNTNMKHIKSSSIYTGVSWDKKCSKWRSVIYVNGSLKHLGFFINEYDAYLAYEKELEIIKTSF